MHKNILYFTLKFIPLVAAGSVLGAYLSKQSNLGKAPWYSSVIPSVLLSLVWGWMTLAKVPLVYASILYDVTVAVTFFLVFALMGEHIGWLQVLGLFFAILGTTLVSL